MDAHMVREAKNAYFQVILVGYLGVIPPPEAKIVVERSRIGGLKVVQVAVGSFVVTDAWGPDRTNLGGSSGKTTIRLAGMAQHFWEMSYNGHYPEPVVPVVKAALAENCQLGVFIGGRGPDNFEFGEFVYRNTVVEGADHGFEQFRVHEAVYDRHGRCHGHHRCEGGLVTKLAKSQVQA